MITLVTLWPLSVCLAVVASDVCPSGWTFYNEETNCYFHGRRKSWGEAKKDCQDLNAKLLETTNLNVYSWLGYILNTTQFWIGLSRSALEAEPSLWSEGEPIQANGDCVLYHLDAPGLAMERCASLENYVCQKSADDPCTHDNGDCGTKTCTRTSDGLTDCGCQPGHVATSKGVCVVDKCKPDNGGCAQRCVMKSADDASCACGGGYVLSQTDDFHCEAVDPCAKKGKICGKDKCNMIAPGVHTCLPTQKERACSDGWVFYPDGFQCVLYVSKRSSWHEANEECTNKYASQIILKQDAHQITWIKDTFNMSVDTWVGLSNTMNTRRYQWNDDTPVDKDFFRKRIVESSYAKPTDTACVMFWTERPYKLTFSPCGQRRPFICQKPAIDLCETDNGDCIQACGISNLGVVNCSCYDNHTMTDSNVCAENDICKINNGGCPATCRVTGPGKRTCMGTNESFQKGFWIALACLVIIICFASFFLKRGSSLRKRRKTRRQTTAQGLKAKKESVDEGKKSWMMGKSESEMSATSVTTVASQRSSH